MKRNENETSKENNVTYVKENGAFSKPTDKRTKKRIRIAAVAGLLVLLAVIALAVIKSTGWLSAERIALSVFDAGRKNTAQDNLPIEMNGLKVRSVDSVGYCVGVLDGLKYTLYSPEYNVICSYTHNLSEPTSKTTDRRALIFERGNKKLTVISREGVVSERITQFPVISADINRRNMTAFVTTAERYLGQVTVCNDRDEPVVIWSCSDNYVTDVAISPDGKRFAVSLLKTENGEQISGVRVFDIGEKEAAASFEFYSDTVMDVVYFEDGGLCAVGTSSVKFIDRDLRLTGVYQYDTDKLAFYDTSYSGVCALVFEPQTGKKDYACRIISREGETEYEFDVNEPGFFTVDDNGGVYICSDGAIYIYSREKDADGSAYSVSVLTKPQEAVRVLPKQEKLVVLSIFGLNVYAVNEKTE